jgi:prevent-host-death family protein
MQQFNLDEAKTHLAELIDAAIKGEEVIIVKNENESVQIVAIAKPLRKPQFGSAKGLFTISEDFDEPLEDFKEYMQ